MGEQVRAATHLTSGAIAGNGIPYVQRELVCRPAHRCLRGHVLGYRGFRFGEFGPRRRLVVPDGVVKIMFGFGEPMSMVDAVDPRRRCDAASLVNALRTTAVVGQHSGLLHGVTALLTPLAAYRVFNVPAPEWTDEPVDPVAFLGREGRLLTEKLAECPGWEQRFALLDAVFTARLSKGRSCGPELVHAWRKLQHTAGRARVEELAADCCWSRRHLERRFRECVGLSPKAVAQILRLQSALQLRHGGLRWTQVAAETGYYDQAHFDHVFRSMIGCTPSHFHAHRTAGLSSDPLDFLPGRVTSILLPRAAATRR